MRWRVVRRGGWSCRADLARLQVAALVGLGIHQLVSHPADAHGDDHSSAAAAAAAATVEGKAELGEPPPEISAVVPSLHRVAPRAPPCHSPANQPKMNRNQPQIASIALAGQGQTAAAGRPDRRPTSRISRL